MIPFQALPAFNEPRLRPLAGLRARLDQREPALLGDRSPAGRALDALARRACLPVKEICEAFEVFARARRRLRAPSVADLCAGHGLAGMLFALFERSVEQVTLLDQRIPDSHAAALEALAEVGPWVRQKVRYVRGRVQQAAALLPAGTSILAIHACGARTDRCIEAAIALGGKVAVMPCCHARSTTRAPRALLDALGAPLACDVQRTYALEAAGYAVEWAAIPAEITPMNRILIGLPRRPAPPGPR